MDNRERMNVYFEMERNFYMLFQVVNIGTKNIPDFKFSGFSNLYINHKTDNNKEDDKGYLTEEEIEKSTIHSYIETSAKLIVQNLLISSYFCTFIV